MAFRKATGRPINVQRTPRDARALLRRHLREEGKTIKELATVWRVRDTTAYRVFYSKRRLSPQYIDAAIEFLGLDEFDAQELRLRGAIEAGWQLNPGVVFNVAQKEKP